MWTAIPEGSTIDKSVLKLKSQAPLHYDIYVINGVSLKEAHAAIEEAVKMVKGSKYHPEHLDQWHRRILGGGHGSYVCDQPWDVHPNYSGPPDTRIYAYSPQLVEDRLIAKAKKEGEESRKRMLKEKEEAAKAANTKAEAEVAVAQESTA